MQSELIALAEKLEKRAIRMLNKEESGAAEYGFRGVIAEQGFHMLSCVSLLRAQTGKAPE
jgi:hypothetical protein